MNDAGWMIFGALLAGIAAATTGCSTLGDSHTGYFDDGYISVQGDARGMRAFGDAMNGLITNGKATPDMDTPFYVNRRAEDAEITKRVMIEESEPPQGLWQKLWGAPVQPQQPAK